MRLGDTHDPGGKIKVALPEGVTGWAKFSACRRYRTVLGRDDAVLQTIAKPGVVLFCGMNPSMAEAEADDPTVIREWGFTKRWGYAHYVKVNFGDYRATHPRDLLMPGLIVCRKENIDEIAVQARAATIVVMAHGVLPKPLIEPGARITQMLRDIAGHKLFCLGRTKSGMPRHPLYLRSDQPLERF